MPYSRAVEAPGILRFALELHRPPMTRQRNPKEALTAERLREVLHYDPETGIFTWIKPTGPAARKGSIAGRVGVKGYRRIGVYNCLVPAATLAWFYVRGQWPTNHLDHINACRDDNRLSNLRDVDNRTNQENKRRAKVTNSSGLLGVSRRKDRGSFVALINVHGKRNYLGGVQDGRRGPCRLRRCEAQAAQRMHDLEDAALASLRIQPVHHLGHALVMRLLQHLAHLCERQQTAAAGSLALRGLGLGYGDLHAFGLCGAACEE